MNVFLVQICTNTSAAGLIQYEGQQKLETTENIFHMQLISYFYF